MISSTSCKKQCAMKNEGGQCMLKLGRITNSIEEGAHSGVCTYSIEQLVTCLLWDHYRQISSITNIHRIICMYRRSTTTNWRTDSWESWRLVSCIPWQDKVMLTMLFYNKFRSDFRVGKIQSVWDCAPQRELVDDGGMTSDNNLWAWFGFRIEKEKSALQKCEI